MAFKWLFSFVTSRLRKKILFQRHHHQDAIPPTDEVAGYGVGLVGGVDGHALNEGRIGCPANLLDDGSVWRVQYECLSPRDELFRVNLLDEDA